MSVASALMPPTIHPYPVWRFSVADYHGLIDIGVLDENDHVELLAGWLVSKISHGPLMTLLLSSPTNAFAFRFRMDGACESNRLSPLAIATLNPTWWLFAAFWDLLRGITHCRQRSGC